MKQLIITVSALCAVALLLVYCTEITFDNPLDKKAGKYYLDGDTTEQDAKTRHDGSGMANFFNPDSNAKWACDDKAPEVTIVGANSITVINPTEQNVYNKWMGSGGWTDVVKVNGGRTPLEKIDIRPAYLEQGSNIIQFNPEKMPEEGNYTIVYTAEKPVCDNGTKPPSGIARRGLVVKNQVIVITDPPYVVVTGPTQESITVGSQYTDKGAKAYEPTGAEIPLTKIEVNGQNINSTNPSNIVISTSSVRTYTITYYTRSLLPENGKESSATRTVSVVPVVDPTGWPTYIVFNPYAHRFNSGGAVYNISHPDTAFPVEGGWNNYREKGVSRVYCVDPQTGNQIDIPNGVSLVLANITRSPNTLTSSANQASISYKLPSGTLPNGMVYKEVTATRRIFTYYNDCADLVTGNIVNPGPAPTINFTNNDGTTGTPDAPILQASTGPWLLTTYNRGWTVTSNDGGMAPSGATRQYLLDFGNPPNRLNPDSLRVGTFQLNYVGLGGCGGIAVRPRTLIVR